ncbi:MAG: DHH family phosphoesterase [Lachnospiraceae bacterium]|nr:DHH family phosphoesterase [Lachnospiraceae bacterium]
MKKKVHLKGQLKSYTRWLLLLSILLLAMNACMYSVSIKAGIMVSAFLVIYLLIVIFLYLRSRTQIYNELISFATQYGQIQRKLLKELALPYALLDEEGKVLWGNTAFFEVSGKNQKSLRKSISWFFPEFSKEEFLGEDGEDSKTIRFSTEERDFRVDIRRVYLEHIMEDNALVEMEEDGRTLIAIYMFDETEINTYIRMNKEERLVAGLIYLDNYEEALETVEEVRRSLLVALVDRKINKYIGAFGGIVKKMEKDKYFIAIQEKHVPIMRENKFELLQDVKTVNIGNEMAVTLSMGLGLSGSSFAENYDYARIAIDLALARGGDQVVTKEGESITYFGGKTQQMEKATRVKARVKAHALREFIESREKVMVMGHKMGDMDSFGASVGIYRAAKVLGKRAYIVINDITNSVRPLRESFNDNPVYETDMFLRSDEALELIDRNTVLVVVDTNRPNYTECSELLGRTPTIVVLDHHRQTNEQIENAVLSYIEPYASSACEMVAEILQYFDEGLKIKTTEADCLYAGIVLDTDNFMRRTGVRTFEAAAFLRRCGADVTRVRKMFRNEMVEYKARAEAVRHAEVYHGFAISVCPNENLESPTIVGAQAADELLDIRGVRASIVLTYYQHRTFVSARSIDEVNVQILTERLGGGGHMNMAGAQLDCGVEEAMEIVKHTIEKMQEEGEFE